MKIELLFECTYKVYVVVLEGKGHDCAHFLSEDWEAPNKRSEIACNKLFAQIEQLAKDPRNMARPLHQICDEIWQLEQDQYRIPWFYDKGRIIICTHYFVKKKNKTPKAEKDRAKKIREEYKKGDRNEIRE